MGLPDDRGAQLVTVGQLGDLPPVAGWDFEHRLQRPARRSGEWYARELDRFLRPGGREDPADAQTLVLFGGRPRRLGGPAEPLGQEQQDRA